MKNTSSLSGQRREHEFTESEDEALKGFASAAITWGGLCAVAAAACLFVAGGGAFGVRRTSSPGFFLAAGLAEMSLAIAFIGSGRAFLAAVRTQGSDITHAMRALKFLSRAFLVQIAVAIAVVGLALFAGAVSLGGVR